MGNALSSKSLRDQKEFDDFVSQLQIANKELAAGNPGLIKSLWSKQNDVTVVGKPEQLKAKGWNAVALQLDTDSHVMSNQTAYSFDNVTTQVGTDLAWVLQREHYRKDDGTSLNLNVTILCRRENGEWKIAHRHAEQLD